MRTTMRMPRTVRMKRNEEYGRYFELYERFQLTLESSEPYKHIRDTT